MTKTMNKLKVLIPSSNPRKYAGQGMVEFALALPILLLVVYGLLETGRLIFIYASTLNAARQAVRYGSASGLSNAGVPYYRDCDGIRGAATRVGFLSLYNDINITYDGGLDTSGNIENITGIDSSPTADTCSIVKDTDLENGDRIKVQVSTQWTPIIAIIPSWQGFTITSSAERTLLMDVAIGVDPVGQSWEPGGVLDLTISGAPATYDQVGDVLNFTYVLSNIGTIDLTGLSITDNPGITECSLPATLAQGASFTCNVTYYVVQADLDAGSYTNIVFANSTQALSDTKSVTINAIQTPALNLTKTPSQSSASTAGTVITYTYKLTNSGNVTLTSPYTVTDNKIASANITCPSSGDIAPGNYINCTGPYSITASDITNGSVTNNATATATFGTLPITSNSASATVNTGGLSLKITPSTTTATTLNQKITYFYELKNISSTSISGPIITDSLASNLSCPSGSIGPGSTITCTGEYYVTQANLDAGTTIVNTATASADGGSIKSNVDTASVTISQSAALSLTITPSTNMATTLGAPIIYDYIVTNTGNVTLSAPFTVTDSGITGPLTCTLSSGSLAPLGTTTCTKAYNVSQADLDAGSIISLAVVTVQFNGNTVSSSQATATVTTYNGARLTLSISSTPTSFTGSSYPLSIKFTLKNTGNTVLTSPYSVTANPFLGAVSCASAVSPLNIGQSTDCTASYTTTSTDVSNGSVNISATAKANNGAITSNTATYSVPAILGCYVYHRLTTTPPPSITFSGLGANRKMYMSIINDSATGYTINISSIEVSGWNYNTHSDQRISLIKYGGINIVTTESAHASTVTFNTFVGDVSLAPGATKVLQFEFKKNYSENGNEVIKVTFTQPGCPTLNSSNGTQVK